MNTKEILCLFLKRRNNAPSATGVERNRGSRAVKKIPVRQWKRIVSREIL